MWIHAFNRIPDSSRPCGILFESEDCDTSGLEILGVRFNNWYKEISLRNRTEDLQESSIKGRPTANTAKAVLVKPGCTFFGYDEDNGQGESFTVTAPLTVNYTTFTMVSSNTINAFQLLRVSYQSCRVICFFYFFSIAGPKLLQMHMHLKLLIPDNLNSTALTKQ